MLLRSLLCLRANARQHDHIAHRMPPVFALEHLRSVPREVEAHAVVNGVRGVCTARQLLESLVECPGALAALGGHLYE